MLTLKNQASIACLLGGAVNQDASSVVQVDENVIAIQLAKDTNMLLNRSCWRRVYKLLIKTSQAVRCLPYFQDSSSIKDEQRTKSVKVCCTWRHFFRASKEFSIKRKAVNDSFVTICPTGKKNVWRRPWRLRCSLSWNKTNQTVQLLFNL